MKNPTLELQSQIQAYEAELASLQSELKRLIQPKADPQPDSSPSAIASAIRQSAKDTAEKQGHALAKCGYNKQNVDEFYGIDISKIVDLL